MTSGEGGRRRDVGEARDATRGGCNGSPIGHTRVQEMVEALADRRAFRGLSYGHARADRAGLTPNGSTANGAGANGSTGNGATANGATGSLGANGTGPVSGAAGAGAPANGAAPHASSPASGDRPFDVAAESSCRDGLEGPDGLVEVEVALAAVGTNENDATDVADDVVPGSQRADAAGLHVAGGLEVPEGEGGEFGELGEAVDAMDAVVRLLGAPTLRRLDVAANTGIPPDRTRRFWHALGFAAAPSEDDARYTIADQEAIARTVSILASGKVDEQLALALTRAIARSLDRLAAWQSSLIMESVLLAQTDQSLHGDDLGPGDGTADLPTDLAATLALEREADEQLWHRRLSPTASREAGKVLLELVDDIEPLIIYAWRRHLAATIGRLMTHEEQREDEGPQRTVGFADMVGFTTLVRRLSERQLAQLVQHYEELAADIVASRGGQIVKMLGDEVVYVANSPEAAADIALDLLDIVADDPAMPQLRIGMAHGPVLSHLGDIFGTTVNRASRLTNVAQPHTVVVDDAMAASLAGAPGYDMSRLPPRALRGLGMTVVWHLGRGKSVPRRGRATG